MKPSLSYFAGLWDGEGCFTILYVAKKRRRKSPYWAAVASICQTDRAAISALQKKFGGKIHKRKRSGHWKDVYEWRLWSYGAKRLAEKLLPYLLIKQHAAEILIAFQTYITKQSTYYGGGRLLTKRDMRRRTSFRAQIRRENRRGKI
jgi:hypothetical protein